jgi:hypothetical protein
MFKRRDLYFYIQKKKKLIIKWPNEKGKKKGYRERDRIENRTVGLVNVKVRLVQVAGRVSVRVRVQQGDAVAQERRALVQTEHLGLEVNRHQVVIAGFVAVQAEIDRLLVVLLAVGKEQHGERVHVIVRLALALLERDVLAGAVGQEAQVLVVVERVVQAQAERHAVVVLHLQVAQVDMERVGRQGRDLQVLVVVLELLLLDVELDVVLRVDILGAGRHLIKFLFNYLKNTL